MTGEGAPYPHSLGEEDLRWVSGTNMPRMIEESIPATPTTPSARVKPERAVQIEKIAGLVANPACVTVRPTAKNRPCRRGARGRN